MTLDSTTALATNSPALAADRVSFIKARVFGQETTSNQYVYATTFDIVVTTANDGTPTIASSYENIIRNNPPGQELWNVTPDAFQIGGAPFFTFEVKSVTTNSTVKWIGVLDITVVS